MVPRTPTLLRRRRLCYAPTIEPKAKRIRLLHELSTPVKRHRFGDDTAGREKRLAVDAIEQARKTVVPEDIPFVLDILERPTVGVQYEKIITLYDNLTPKQIDNCFNQEYVNLDSVCNESHSQSNYLLHIPHGEVEDISIPRIDSHGIPVGHNNCPNQCVKLISLKQLKYLNLGRPPDKYKYI